MKASEEMIGHLIGERQTSGSSSATNMFMTDALGSVQAVISNTQNSAALLANQVFSPYGTALSQNGNFSQYTNKGFTGQYTDPTSGLDYYISRYYDPVAGIFLSADTKEGNAQGMNPYAYVAQNPETLSDPSGQMIDCGPGCGNGNPPPAPPPPPNHGPVPCTWQGCENGNSGSTPHTNPCPGGGDYCERTDIPNNPGISALRSSQVTLYDTVSGKGFRGLVFIIDDLQQALLWLITQPLAALLDPNNAAQLSSILGLVSGAAGLAAALFGLAGDIAAGAVETGTIVSALFATASSTISIDPGDESGPGSAQINHLEGYVNGIIRSLQDFAGSLSDSVLNKMVFTLHEADTYQLVPTMYEGPDECGCLPAEYPGPPYSTDYNALYSVQFTISFYTLN
jgi:RHS repeat-associated protein